ncbi:hypothetical protein [Sphingomonas oryzagri]
MSVEPPAQSFDASTGIESSATQPMLAYGVRLAIVIALGALLLLAIDLQNITERRYIDPDDLVRLQQVRDWMAGQSWFDVTQYRVSPPNGMPMHWSRLLDVPIAGIIWIIRPFTGQIPAEVTASVVVPLLTFACMAALVAAISRRIAGNPGVALLAALLCASDCGVIATARPMRIDHHGWQAVCALAMVLALASGRGWRLAAIAGAFSALWMHISLEGALFTVACGGLLGLFWIVDPEGEQDRLPAYLATIAIVSLALFLVAHGGALFDRNFADAISPIHLIVFALAALGATACRSLAKRTPAWRCAGLGLVALLAAAVYKLFGPQNGEDPFAALGPLSYRLWYLHIAEGLPLWRLPVQIVAIMIGYPLLAVAGTAWALQGADRDRRRMLLTYGSLLLAATLIGIVLQRACYAANLIALPGGVLLMAKLCARAMALRSAILRVAAAFCAIAATSPMSPGIAAIALIPDGSDHASTVDRQQRRAGEACIGLDNLAHLDALPPAVFLTPVSSAEALIVASHHSSVAAGYHRDRVPMEDSIRFFIGNWQDAHAIARHYHVGYVMLCPGDRTATLYAKTAPEGLAAKLASGTPPAWLQPVSVPGLRYARVYRLVD